MHWVHRPRPQGRANSVCSGSGPARRAPFETLAWSPQQGQLAGCGSSQKEDRLQCFSGTKPGRVRDVGLGQRARRKHGQGSPEACPGRNVICFSLALLALRLISSVKHLTTHTEQYEKHKKKKSSSSHKASPAKSIYS